jgi:hypothetical protein
MHQNRGYLLVEWAVQARDLKRRNDFERCFGVNVGVL